MRGEDEAAGSRSAAVQRKIIHIDCDCFFAAIEMRDDPRLAGRPLAVGGAPERRGVVATCNYEARAFGVHSAMSSRRALELCPQLLIVRPRFEAYKAVSQQIHAILHDYSELIEPLSLDEAYLDVSGSPHCAGSATRIAEEIRRRVRAELGITVSAGVAPNKFLAKIASDWRKPDGLWVIAPAEVQAFVAELPVARLHGVGKVTAERLAHLGIRRCRDLREWPRLALLREFGSFGERLWQLAHGVDERPVRVARRRQTLSVEHTFARDLPDLAACQAALPALLAQLEARLARLDAGYRLDKPLVKLKFHDFTQTTLEQAGAGLDADSYRRLLAAAFARGGKPVRLIGVGVRLADLTTAGEQLALF